jgi:protein-disulfide isomerase
LLVVIGCVDAKQEEHAKRLVDNRNAETANQLTEADERQRAKKEEEETQSQLFIEAKKLLLDSVHSVGGAPNANVAAPRFAGPE